MARILSINGGSSSLKFAIYEMDPIEQLDLQGSTTGIGRQASRFQVTDGQRHTLVEQAGVLPNHAGAMDQLCAWLAPQRREHQIDAVGHRIVHGGARYSQPVVVSATVVSTLRELVPLAPEHLPQEIAAISAIERIFPNVPQVACFDTAFHWTLPAVAQQYALPRRFVDAGILRYGFHGLSYEYILSELRLLSTASAGGRIVIAHLGNGASMAAIKDGRCIETTMGFTPTGGFMMSTRSGDLDPGVVLYALESLGLDAPAMRHLVSHQAGLLGVSNLSGDVGVLLRAEAHSARAAAALDMFCYQARKFLGGLVVALGGLDTLVFTAGIGEHAPAIRARICAGLEFLGMAIDPERNATNSPIISRDESRVLIRAMPTNEELMIARHTAQTLALTRRTDGDACD